MITKDLNFLDGELEYIHNFAASGKKKIQDWGKLYLGKEACQPNSHLLMCAFDIAKPLIDYCMNDSRRSDELYENVVKFAEEDRATKQEAKELYEKKKADEKEAWKKLFNILRKVFCEKRYAEEFLDKIEDIKKLPEADRFDIQYNWNQYIRKFQKVSRGQNNCIYRWSHG